MSRMMPSVINVSLLTTLGCEPRVSSVGEQHASPDVRARTYARPEWVSGEPTGRGEPRCRRLSSIAPAADLVVGRAEAVAGRWPLETLRGLSVVNTTPRPQFRAIQAPERAPAAVGDRGRFWRSA